LILARVNADYLDELLRTHRPETVAGHLRHVAAAGLVEAAGGSPNALRLIVEQGELGERALRQAGPDAADVVFGDFGEAALRARPVAPLGTHGDGAQNSRQVRLDLTSRSSGLRRDDHPPIAADAGPGPSHTSGARPAGRSKVARLYDPFATEEQSGRHGIKDDGPERGPNDAACSSLPPVPPVAE
jgi:hypothetical protein